MKDKSPLLLEFEAFLDTKKIIQDQIKACLVSAKQYIDAAVELSEEHNLPFRTAISIVDDGYIPTTFGKGQFSKMTPEDFESATGMYDEYGIDYLMERGGWISSREVSVSGTKITPRLDADFWVVIL